MYIFTGAHTLNMEMLIAIWLSFVVAVSNGKYDRNALSKAVRIISAGEKLH